MTRLGAKVYWTCLETLTDGLDYACPGRRSGHPWHWKRETRNELRQ
jgi:hypothetical protein